ncbi:MAG: helix-turn-helix domain-containing protein [Deltaproteobacteria bacterium]|nr:helix-turn-helix domain-containing protein [Deltaproteobacteria bacterium]
MSDTRLLTVKDASQYLGIPEWTLRGKIRLREIPFVKLGSGKKGAGVF